MTVQLELKARDRILESLESTHGSVLNALRTELKVIYENRVITYGEDVAFVTADDARRILRGWEVKAGNWMGSLFRDGKWEFAGEYHLSTTPGSHGNTIKRWRAK